MLQTSSSSSIQISVLFDPSSESCHSGKYGENHLGITLSRPPTDSAMQGVSFLVWVQTHIRTSTVTMTTTQNGILHARTKHLASKGYWHLSEVQNEKKSNQFLFFCILLPWQYIFLLT